VCVRVYRIYINHLIFNLELNVIASAMNYKVKALFLVLFSVMVIWTVIFHPQILAREFVHRFEVEPTCSGKNRETREYQGVELSKTHCHARTYKRMHTIAHTMYPAHTHVIIRTKTSTHKLARMRSRSLLSTHTHTLSLSHSLRQHLSATLLGGLYAFCLFFFSSHSLTHSQHTRYVLLPLSYQ